MTKEERLKELESQKRPEKPVPVIAKKKEARLVISGIPYEPSRSRETKRELLRARLTGDKPKMSDIETKKDRYFVREKGGEVLAYFNNDKPNLDGCINLRYISYFDGEKWRGCYGMNINHKTGEIIFESCEKKRRVEIQITKNNTAKLDDKLFVKI